MKQTIYLVWFANENYAPQSVEVYATSQANALILAQAERIKDGLDYTLHRIDEGQHLNSAACGTHVGLND